LSEERIASIFRVEQKTKQETSNKQATCLFFDLEDGGDTFMRNVMDFVELHDFTRQQNRQLLMVQAI
jgi:hypothetical protein